MFVTAWCVQLGTFASKPVTITPRCFADGLFYCRMTSGHRVPEPFNRRPAVPVLARSLPGPVPNRYRFISVTSLALSATLGAALAKRLARSLAVRDKFDRVAVIVGVATGIMLLPHGLRLALSVPVILDEAALAVGLAWIFMSTSRNVYVSAASVPLAVIAVTTREIWGFAIVAASLLALLWGHRTVAVANAAVAIVTSLRVHSLASVPSMVFAYRGDLETLRFWWDFRFSSMAQVWNTVWALTFAVGLLPVVFILRPPIRWIRDHIRQGDLTAATLLGLGLLFTASAPFLGSDLTRLAYPGAALLLVVALPWIAANVELGLPSIVLGFATLIVWAPAQRLIADRDAYRRYYYPWSRTGSGLTIAAIAIVAAVSSSIFARNDARKRAAPT
jgi:hypothetical protein